MPSGIDYQPIMEGGRIPKKGSDSNIVKGIRYAVNNFWKVLPIGSLINYRMNHQKEEEDNRNNPDYNPISLKGMAKDAFHILYAISGGLLIGAYVSNGIVEGDWNIKHMNKYFDKTKSEQIDTIAKPNELEKSVK